MSMHMAWKYDARLINILQIIFWSFEVLKQPTLNAYLGTNSFFFRKPLY
jgi:hypothetical protein